MKIPFTLLAVLGAAVLAHASTCEVRVDQHPQASTVERVDYCLNAPAQAAAAPGPEVIYYGVTTKAPEKQPEEQEASLRQKYFNSESVKISHSYVDSKRFPPFKNDIPSERERREAYETAQAQAKKEATQQAPKRVMTVMASQTEEVLPDPKQPKKKTKPARIMIAPAVQEVTESSYTEQLETQATAGYMPAPAQPEPIPAAPGTDTLDWNDDPLAELN